MELTQEEKAALLQRAVINSSVEELTKIYGELGFVEMSAPALGLACRFRGLDVVKCLVKEGASFDFPSTEEVEEMYHCYAGTKKGDYRTNYSVYLLKAFGKRPSMPLYCLTGMVMEQQMAREDGSLMTFLPDGERADVLKYLLDNREKIAFHPEELLYYAIFYCDTVLVNELKRQQVRIPEKRVAVIADGAFSPNRYWDEYIDLTRQLTGGDYLDKNRTADFAAEQKKADRKLMQELNCAPDSVLALKKLWSYQKQEDGTLLITNYKGTGVEVTVPERIGRSVVTAVGSAFSGMPVDQKLKINLPETLRCIGDCAFHRIEGLEEIRIPDGVESIGHFAFYECDQLQNIIIPDHVKEIGDHAFQGCSSLVHITIPAQTKSIGMSVFEGCSSLESAAISEGVKKLGSRVFWQCSSLKSVTIPSTVERISPDAFFMCSQLVEVKLCEGVRGIGRDAFEGCVLLTDITIPRSVEEIGAYAFADCQALAELDIRGRIRELGESVFSECSALMEFMIPKTVEKIGDYAFSGCASLKSITIPAAVTEIGKGVFAGCSNLEEVCICGEVKKLGAEAFVNCMNLRMIRIRESIPNRILGETFEQQKGLTVSCPKGSRTEAYCKKKGIPCIIN